MSNLIKSIAVAMALTIPVIASAEVKTSQINAAEIQLSYNSEDATSSYGRKELERQIRRAAAKVCGVQSLRRVGSVRQVMESRSCYDNAVARALKTISTTAG